jgi:hypothetical protein
MKFISSLRSTSILRSGISRQISSSNGKLQAGKRISGKASNFLAECEAAGKPGETEL